MDIVEMLSERKTASPFLRGHKREKKREKGENKTEPKTHNVKKDE
jgi:hypothetical protein